jgi:hypothetical protein
MFYHDHASGITRLNVYVGEASGYVVTDNVEQTLINGGTITTAAGTNLAVAKGTLPDIGIPLVIQDRTFVPGLKQLAVQDPTWNWSTASGKSLVSARLPAQQGPDIVQWNEYNDRSGKRHERIRSLGLQSVVPASATTRSGSRSCAEPILRLLAMKAVSYRRWM